MRQVISFDRVKLTNNEMDDKGHVSDRKVLLICCRFTSKVRVLFSHNDLNEDLMLWLRRLEEAAEGFSFKFLSTEDEKPEDTLCLQMSSKVKNKTL